MALADRFSRDPSPHRPHATPPSHAPVTPAHHQPHHPHHGPRRRVHPDTHTFEGTPGGSGRWVPKATPHPSGMGAPAVATVFENLDDQIRATITSPTGRAYLQLPDGTLRVIEGLLPEVAAPAPGQAPSAPHPLQAVIDEFPEVAQAGSRAHHRFHRAYRRAGSQPEHALHVARTVLR